MSLFRFGKLEAEVDFTDANTLDVIDEAYDRLMGDIKTLPVVGKASDIVRAQNTVYDRFFDAILGDGASEKMFVGSASLEKRIDAAESLADFREKEDDRFTGRLDGYQVKKPSVNREQRRNYQKQKKNRR